MNYYEDIPEDQFVPLTCVPNEFIGKYEINKLGHIKTLGTGKIRYNFNMDDYGYKIVYLCSSNLAYEKHIIRLKQHILLATMFIPNPENRPIVDHIDRNRSNNSLSNLRWVTYSENNSNRGSTRRRDILFEKYDESWNLLETIPIENIPVNSIKGISYSSSTGYKYCGYYWKKRDLQIENYISRFGSPKENEWKECLRCPNYECNMNGIMRKKGSKNFTIGSKTCDGYRQIRINKKPYLVHRLIYETFIGKLLSEDLVVDHISTIRDDNRFLNLRAVTQKDNLNNPETFKKKFKRVLQYSLEGRFIRTFNSKQDAAKFLGVSVYSFRSRIRDKNSVAPYGYLWCNEGEEYIIQERLDQLIFKYDKDYNLVGSYKSYNSVGGSNNSYKARIKKSIETGQLCSDGFYYSRGPRKFD